MTIIVRSRDSLLTTSSGYTNYRGILNLVIILLVLSNARAALENVIKYGILVDPFCWLSFFRQGSKHWPALLIVLSLGFHILIALLIEKIIAKLCQLEASTAVKEKPSSPSPSSGNKISSLASNSTVLLMANAVIVTNLLACISLPPIAVYSHDTHPISTSASLMIVSIVFLKLVSYHMMNFWCRDIRRPEKLQSRTTKSFLRAYTPPALDFAAAAAAAAHKHDEGAGPPTSLVRSDSKAGIPPTPSPSPSPSPDKPDKVEEGAEQQLRKLKPTIGTRSPQTSKRASEEQQGLALKVMAKYPGNVTLSDISSFIIFPTLCYELQYAKTERIRKRFLIKRVIEVIVLSQMDMALIQQWIVPTVSNSVLPFRQMQFSHMLERLLKLAIPNHVIWLIWFYLFFHSLLNIIAELTRFADREFYRDWWNSESVYYFWSNWNIPVHKWCARHLYLPLMSLGLTKCQASTAVFFVSAFFHEYLVSVPLKMFRMWAFTGMLIQLPWARFVSNYFNSHFANVAVWVSLIIGQPLCILMYYHDYYVINNIKSLPSR